MFARIRTHPSTIHNVLPGAGNHLPRVVLFKPKDFRDVAVGIVECFPEEIRGTFGRRQPFQ